MGKRLGMLLGMVLLAVALCAGCGLPAADDSPVSSSASASGGAVGGKLTVQMLNVGQGDAILIKTGEQTTLIDTSDLDEQDKLKRELDKAGVKKIDKLILTHPHADHIGGMDVMLKDFQIGEVYDNGMPSTSKVYLRYMKALKNQKIPRHGLKAGDELDLGSGVRFTVLAPAEELVKKGTQKGYEHDPNNESVVGQLVFGDFRMMFTGDAEASEEKSILSAFGQAQLHSQVLKSGHHGSKTSSSKEWLSALQPEAVLISCGRNNDYGHPHKETMKKYKGMNLKIYETDKNGTITVTSDGHSYEISTEEGKAQ